ncbi:MAG: sugar ABC transporter permease [Anaerolineae bacterium]|nr:sugar ABC transporter permease [Anaerolineae bacterium]
MRRERRFVTALFIGPALAIYLIFFIFPAIQALWTSLYDWRGFTEDATFVGLKNFSEMSRDNQFWASLGNTLGIVFFGGLAVFALAFVFTALLDSHFKGRKFFRAVIFMPNVIAPVALATLWGFIYNPRFGLLNSFARALGLEDLAITTWMAPDTIYWSVMVALVWIYVGFYTVLLMAGVDKIPQEMFEAAQIEGASGFQIFTRVTIPMIWDVIAVGVVLWGITALKMFEFLYAISGILPPRELWTVSIYLYVMGFGKRDPIFRLGYATAIGVALLLVVIVFIILVRRLLRREALEF